MRFKILVLLTFVVISCQKKAKVNPDVLPKDKMVGILIDIHILESKIEKLSIRKDSGRLIFNTFEREIFEAHQVDKEKYLMSYQYYMEDLSGMNEIYNAVVDSLNYMQRTQEAEKKNKEDIEKDKRENKKKLKEKAKKEKDSLSKIEKIPKLIAPQKELEEGEFRVIIKD